MCLLSLSLDKTIWSVTTDGNDVDLKARNQNRKFSMLEVIDRVDEVYNDSEVPREFRRTRNIMPYHDGGGIRSKYDGAESSHLTVRFRDTFRLA